MLNYYLGLNADYYLVSMLITTWRWTPPFNHECLAVKKAASPLRIFYNLQPTPEADSWSRTSTTAQAGVSRGEEGGLAPALL